MESDNGTTGDDAHPQKKSKSRNHGRSNKEDETNDDEKKVQPCKPHAPPVRGETMPMPCNRCCKQGIDCHQQAEGKGQGACYECGKLKLKCMLKETERQTMANCVPKLIERPMPKPKPTVLKRPMTLSQHSSVKLEDEMALVKTIYIDKGKSKGKHVFIL